METALFEQIMLQEAGQLDPAVAQVQAWADSTTGLQRVALYAARIQRAIEKTTSELKEMQSNRKTAYAKAEQEAILLTQLAHAKGQPPDQSKEFPSPELCGGFVYSLPEIARLVARVARLEEAKARFMAAA
jgi:hypothetical protein